MDLRWGSGISLKALVDKENNRVILAESDEDFIDVLFSFLTMPMGTIIRVTRGTLPIVTIGCINNLYGSVYNLDPQRFQTEACKTMLLYPRNAAEDECKRLKLYTDDGDPLKYFLCNNRNCRISGKHLLSHYRNAICSCGERMDFEMPLTKKESTGKVFDARDRGTFLKGLTRFIVTDALEVMAASTEESFSLLNRLQVTDVKAIEERKFHIGLSEVFTLLKYSLVAEATLTTTLLKQNPKPESGQQNFCRGRYARSRVTPTSNTHGEILVKLTVSKSKNKVCYAEANEDFVDLLFSFLAVPLGYIVKEIRNTFGGCIAHLYNSVEKLDAMQCLKSNKHKEMLLSPKLAPDFSYNNHPLSIEQDGHPPYYFESWTISNTKTDALSSKKSSSCNISSMLTVLDPKSHAKDAKSGGFLIGPAKFTITDDLTITPISPVLCLSLLSKLEVALDDVEECIVHVSSEEALKLLVASLDSESALTNVFLRQPHP